MINSAEKLAIPKTVVEDWTAHDASPEAAIFIWAVHRQGKMETQVNPSRGITGRLLNDYYDDRSQPFPGKDRKSWVEMIEDPSQRIRVINDKNGLPLAVARSFEAEGAHWIGSLSVARRARGQGLAEAMLDDSQFGCHDGRELSLKVAIHNLRAIRVYERAGFEVVAEDSYPIFNHSVPQHVMTRPGNT